MTYSNSCSVVKKTLTTEKRLRELSNLTPFFNYFELFDWFQSVRPNGTFSVNFFNQRKTYKLFNDSDNRLGFKEATA